MSISHVNEIRQKISNFLSSGESRTLGLLEKKTGVDKGTISRIQSKETVNPRGNTLYKIEKGLRAFEADNDIVQKSPIIDKPLEEIIDSFEDETKNEEERVSLDDHSISIITRNCNTGFVYSLILNTRETKVYRSSIKEELGNQGINALDFLIKNGQVKEDREGALTPKFRNIYANSSEFMIKQMSSELSNFDEGLLGEAAALIRLCGETSYFGYQEARKIAYQAGKDIRKVLKGNPGKIPYFYNNFYNTYSRSKYFENKNEE